METLETALQHPQTLPSVLAQLDSSEKRRALSLLTSEQRQQIASSLDLPALTALVRELADPQAIDFLEELPIARTAEVIAELPPEIGSHFLREISEHEPNEVIGEIPDENTSSELQRRLNYPEGTAGSLMRGAPVTFPDHLNVAALLDGLADHNADYRDRDIQYLYLVDSAGHLTGILQLRQLLFAPRNASLATLMLRDLLTVTDITPLNELADLFSQNSFLGLPVVDSSNRLLGIVPRDSVQQETADEQTELFLQSAGVVGGEELRSMPLFQRCRKRLAWLAPNIALNLVAASVIAANEATLQEVIALAVFLPIVSDMSGCSGNQAVAVSIRELTLDLLRPGDYLRVIMKEGLVGIINGLVLGTILGTVAALWKDNLYLGLVVAAALSLNTILSVLLGGLVPLLLKRLKVDPALASGPILTTCTDMCGFFLVLSLASAALSKLV
ncbi:MAG: magnesium transporter [Verrucomicrobiota bacterium]